MFKINFASKDREKIYAAQKSIHSSMVGSPAYVDSEIVLSDIAENNDEFIFPLLIANNNDANSEITVDLDVLNSTVEPLE